MAFELQRDAGTDKFLKEIDGWQNEILALNELARKEFLNMNQWFNAVRKPYFDKRAEIISKVPNFWPITFTNHPNLSFLVQVGEEELLKHLVKLDVEEFEESGYRIHFHFDENPYFENAVLTKEFQLAGTPTSYSIPIRWKEGRTDEPICTGLDRRAFAAWYEDHLNPSSDIIANMIRDDLWQNPLQYFQDPVIEIEDDDEVTVVSADQEVILIEDDADETAE